MIYIYECSLCFNEKEVEHRMKECDTIEVRCECGNVMRRRIVGGSGFQLNGATWAKDGYKSHGLLNPVQRDDRKR